MKGASTAGILKRDKLATAGQVDGVVERAGTALFTHGL